MKSNGLAAGRLKNCRVKRCVLAVHQDRDRRPLQLDRARSCRHRFNTDPLSPGGFELGGQLSAGVDRNLTVRVPSGVSRLTPLLLQIWVHRNPLTDPICSSWIDRPSSWAKGSHNDTLRPRISGTKEAPRVDAMSYRLSTVDNLCGSEGRRALDGRRSKTERGSDPLGDLLDAGDLSFTAAD